MGRTLGEIARDPELEGPVRLAYYWAARNRPLDDAEMDLLNMAIEAQVALCWLHACFKNNLPVSAELFADVTRSKNAAITMLGIEDPYPEKAN